jgi:tetratricopeptide (TPR) repeat protein
MPNRYRLSLLCVWPGLAQIWTGQEALGVILAALFAVTVNVAILARFVWTELFLPGTTEFLCALAVLTWLGSLAYTLAWLARWHPDRHRAAIDAQFREALEAYLQGRWNDARRLFEGVLARDDSDADALLYLGSLYLRTGQPELARRALRQCLEQAGGARWAWEAREALARIDAHRPAAGGLNASGSAAEAA